MSYRECEHTETVVAAAGAPTPELERHAETCPACADALLVARFLAREAEPVRAAAPVPAAGAVWDRAQARLRAEAVERATRPIVLFQRVAWVCGALAAGGAVVGFHGALGSAVASVVGALGDVEWGDAAPLSGAGGLVAGALVLATLFFGLYTIWAEEA